MSLSPPDLCRCFNTGFFVRLSAGFIPNVFLRKVFIFFLVYGKIN